MKQKQLIAIGVITAALSLYASANAQMTGAGVSITNKASANYLDSTGQPKSTESNEVVTTVQQVYGISLTPNTTSGSNGTTAGFRPYEVTNNTAAPSVQNNKSATPNSQVRFDYILVNNGNGNDTITLAAVQDNTDSFDVGSPTFFFDAALTSPIPGNQVILTPGQQINVYVKATVPPSATTSQLSDIDVTATGLIPNGADTNANTSDDNRDNNNTARVTVVADAILTPTKTGQIEDCDGINPGTQLCILYTITGSNSGTQPARAVTLTGPQPALAADNTLGIVVSDVIPAGTELDTTFAPTASGGTVQRIMYSTSSSATDPLAADWTSGATISVVRVGALLKNAATGALGAVIAPAGNFSLTFRVRILTTTLPGADITNTVQATYNNNVSPTNVRQDVFASTTNSNPVTRDVAIGPNGDPYVNPDGTIAGFTDPVTGLAFTYTEGGQGKATLNPAPLGFSPIVDFTQVATAATGTFVSYVLTLQNRGNDQDQFVLNYITPNGLVANINESFLPAGATVGFYDASGNTSLSGNTTTNVVAGGSTNIVVKIFVPANATANTASDVLRARIKVESLADPSKTDFTIVRVADLTPGQSVDLENETNATPGSTENGNTPAGTTVTKSITPSPSAPVTVAYPITVQNTGASTDSFNLTTASLPSGVTGVQFFLDANADGIPDSPTPLVGGNTGSLPAGSTGNYVAILTVGINAAPVPQDGNAGDTNDGASDDDFTIITTSASNPAVFDSIVDSLVILPLNTLTLTPSRNGDVTSPGSIQYPHTLTNDGSSAVTSALFDLSGLPLGSGTLGFSYNIYRDTDNSGTFTGGDVLVYSYDGTTNAVVSNNILAGSLASGASVPFVVQVNAASGLPEGTIDTRTLTVTGTFGANGTGTSSVIDTTRIVKGELRLRKFANPCDSVLSQGGVCPSFAPDPVTVVGTVLPRNRPGALLPSSTDLTSQVTYTIVGENIGSTYIGGTALGAIITDPIPADSDYVIGSASATCSVVSPAITCTLEYSTDNAATWSATQPADNVTTGTSGGISDAADAVRVTNIRVRVTGSTVALLTNAIQNGAKITLTFKVSVR
jgi:trimeric autotransporter adhesin